MRLLVHVEGQTEETFVNELLRPHLTEHGFSSVTARLLGNARKRTRRGGVRAWPSVRDEILRHLKQDPTCIATTMVDYYAMPASGSKAWPGRQAASSLAYPENAKSLEEELSSSVNRALHHARGQNRFIPFVIMHEFEALLFSDCEAFSQGIERPELKQQLQAIRDLFKSPEEINDSPELAPSKRIATLIPGYEKPLYGVLAALAIGLPKIRQECSHFNHWLTKLESLPTPGPIGFS